MLPGYSQPYILNNSMKTHLLKHRHDRRREKRYVVVTCSLTDTSNNSIKIHLLIKEQTGKEERKEICGGYSQPINYIKQFNENSPSKA